MLVGRARERAAIDQALAVTRAGRCAVLGFVGPPGIGKTSLLEYAAERAGAMMVLQARGIESEATIPFAALLELLRPTLALLDQISTPQAAALERAFALRPGPAQDRFAVGAATLSLVAACAETTPVLLLLDDVQWFDVPSSEALRFMLRRLAADPVAAVVAVREGHQSVLDGTELVPLAVDGLTPAEARLLRGDLPEASTARLVDATGGNPLALLELKAPDESVLAPAGAPILVPDRIAAAYRQRAALLSEGARRCLLLAAASDSGDMQLLGQAAETVGLDIADLAEAEAGGLVYLAAGRVEFQHPLVRSAIYTGAGLGARREAHRSLAAVLPDHDLERRAWHLAAAAVGNDEPAAIALERAADRALERGGHASATAAFERAARLTATPGRRARLLARSAHAAWEAGSIEQARRLLDESQATDSLTDAETRASRRLAGLIATSHGPVMQGYAILTAAASDAATQPAGAEHAIGLLADAVFAAFIACEPVAIATAAAEMQNLLPLSAPPATKLLVTTVSGVSLILGGDAASGAKAIREAIELCEHAPELLQQPALLPWIGMAPLFLRESDTGRAQLETALRSARESGAIGALPFVLGLIGRDQATTDRWRLAQATYEEAIALARETDQRTWLAFSLAGLAWLEARQGRERECRLHAEECLLLADELEARLPALWALSALGELELGRGQPAVAIEHFEKQRQVAYANTVRDVDLWPGAEMVEANVMLSRQAPARALTTRFVAAAEAKGQPWSLARARRCQALLAGTGAFPGLFEDAIAHHVRTPDGFELARTRLLYGERLRRSRNRVLARTQLRAAEEIFTALDARPWRQRARAELEATGETIRRGEHQSRDELTPQELQIATLLAAGRTTREAAAALFLSPKTIEYHLRHVYLKLGIHSREELAHVIHA
jgi:DNA-binding CsgD family transcriptional regulator